MKDYIIRKSLTTMIYMVLVFAIAACMMYA